MSDGAIITFNANGKKLTNGLDKAFKTRNKAIPCITGDFSTSYAKFLQFSFKLFDGFKVSFSPDIGNYFTCGSVVGID